MNFVGKRAKRLELKIANRNRPPPSPHPRFDGTHLLLGAMVLLLSATAVFTHDSGDETISVKAPPAYVEPTECYADDRQLIKDCDFSDCEFVALWQYKQSVREALIK